MKKQTQNTGNLYLLSAAFAYSTMPILIRFLDAGNIPPISQVAMRYGFAFMIAFIYFVLIKKNKIELSKISPFLILVSVVGYGTTNLFFTKAILATTITSALFAFYTFALITPVLGSVFLKDKLKPIHIGALIVSAIGLSLLFDLSGGKTTGILFGLLSALTQSGYLIGTRKLKDLEPGFILLSSTFFGFIAIGLLALILETNFYTTQLASLSPSTWLATILFGLLNFIGWFLMSKGFQLAKASTGSLILLVENLFAIIFGYFLFSEIPTLGVVIGGLLILTSSALDYLKE